MSDPLTYLFGLGQFGMKFGLDNIEAIVERLGHPERAFRAIHIAGTNGKGSVTAMVDAALRANGCRSARYTSPHLVKLNERFVIDGRAVADESLLSAVSDVRDAVERLQREGRLTVHPTFFEVTTAAAFELFRRAGIEVAVIEVGLGGRLDATNVVSPLMTAITSIDFDHEKYLGTTLNEIAREKAGIIKPDVPVIVGQMAPDASATIEAIATHVGAPVVRVWDNISVEPRRAGTGDGVRLRTPVADYGEIVLGLRGEHQIGNAVVAVRLLEALDARGITVTIEAIKTGLAKPDWPGRLELRRLANGREILLDAAHNPAGAAALALYLNTWDAPPPLVFAAMKDKNIDGMLRALLPTVGMLVATKASNPRSADPADILARAQAILPKRAGVAADSAVEALDAAWRVAPRIVVAGSVFLLGDVMKEIESS